MGKTFTLGEAQRLLPGLGVLVGRAREAAVRANLLDYEMQALSHRISLAGGLHVDVSAAARSRAERDKCNQEAKSTLLEIEGTGATVSDLGEGLVEMPSTLEGRPVLLCWRLGESEIHQWRETEDEADVRREIDGRFGHGERPN